MRYYENRKEPKMDMFDFRSCQSKMQMSSHGKNLIHMLFWEFHGTPRIKGKGWRRKDPYNLYGIRLHDSNKCNYL